MYIIVLFWRREDAFNTRIHVLYFNNLKNANCYNEWDYTKLTTQDRILYVVYILNHDLLKKNSDHVEIEASKSNIIINIMDV